MGNSARHEAKPVELLGLKKARRQTVALGHIRQENELSHAPAQRAHAEFEAALHPVDGKGRLGLSAGERGTELRHDAHGGTAEHPLRLAPEDLLSRRVDVGNASGTVQDDDPAGHCLENGGTGDRNQVEETEPVHSEEQDDAADGEREGREVHAGNRRVPGDEEHVGGPGDNERRKDSQRLPPIGSRCPGKAMQKDHGSCEQQRVLVPGPDPEQGTEVRCDVEQLGRGERFCRGACPQQVVPVVEPGQDGDGHRFDGRGGANESGGPRGCPVIAEREHKPRNPESSAYERELDPEQESCERRTAQHEQRDENIGDHHSHEDREGKRTTRPPAGTREDCHDSRDQGGKEQRPRIRCQAQKHIYHPSTLRPDCPRADHRLLKSTRPRPGCQSNKPETPRNSGPGVVSCTLCQWLLLVRGGLLGRARTPGLCSDSRRCRSWFGRGLGAAVRRGLPGGGGLACRRLLLAGDLCSGSLATLALRCRRGCGWRGGRSSDRGRRGRGSSRRGGGCAGGPAAMPPGPRGG